MSEISKATDEAREISFPAEYLEIAQLQISTAVRTALIYSPDLNSDSYGSHKFANSLSVMVRSNRHARCRILLGKDDGLLKSESPLLELARKLPSLCTIRVAADPPAKFQQDFMIIDTRCILFRKSEQEKLAWFDPQAPAEAAQRIDHFNYFWNRASSTPALRQLSI